MSFKKREVLHDEPGWGSDFVKKDVKSDGYLTVIIKGKDQYWTRLILACKITSEGKDILVGGVSWAYSAQQSFEKIVSATIPVRKDESCTITAKEKSAVDNLRVTVIWMPE